MSGWMQRDAERTEDDREEMTAKDSEIATLSAALARADADAVRVKAERDEARECVRRLYRWAAGHQNCLQLSADPDDPEELDELHRILEETPEHLR